MFTELFDKKLKVNPKEKAKKLAFIVRDCDMGSQELYHQIFHHEVDVLCHSQKGMICKLLEEILNSFQMKGKLRKGRFCIRSFTDRTRNGMKTIRKLMVYLVKNAPGDDAYVTLTII